MNTTITDRLFPITGVILACILSAGCGGMKGRSGAIVDKFATGMPRAEAEKKVREFEANLAKKSASFDRETAWKNLEAEADRVAAANKKKEDIAAEGEKRFAAAPANWDKWKNSGKASGHLFDQLKTMHAMGKMGLEKALSLKFEKVPGMGERIFFQLPSGVRIEACHYGGKALTGFEISLSSSFKGDKADILKALELPSSEFDPVSVKWSPVAYRWRKLSRPLGYETDIDWNPSTGRALVFWTGP